MGVRKKGGSWFIDYRVEGRRKREKIGPSKRLADAVLAKRRTEIAEGRFLDRKKTPKIRFEDFASEYLEYSEANKRNYGRECGLRERARHRRGELREERGAAFGADQPYAARRARRAPPGAAERGARLPKRGWGSLRVAYKCLQGSRQARGDRGLPLPRYSSLLRLASRDGRPGHPHRAGALGTQEHYDDAPLQPPLTHAPREGRGDPRQGAGATAVDTFWTPAGRPRERGVLNG